VARFSVSSTSSIGRLPLLGAAGGVIGSMAGARGEAVAGVALLSICLTLLARLADIAAGVLLDEAPEREAELLDRSSGVGLDALLVVALATAVAASMARFSAVFGFPACEGIPGDISGTETDVAGADRTAEALTCPVVAIGIPKFDGLPGWGGGG
jgi:hypothetical protein